MKTNTPESMKFKRLARRLKTSRCHTVGLLELLWIATAKNCPQGDIGKFTNEEIAIECDWEGDHDELVAALLDCGWLDIHDECRLVVHDWADHAPNHVASNLKRWGKWFIVPEESPKEPPKESPKESPKDVPPSLAKPSQALPGQAKPILAAARAADGHLDFGPLEGTGKVSDAAIRLASAIDKRRIEGMDSDWIWRHSAVGELLKPGFIADTASKVLERQVRKPKAYIEKAIREECQAVGIQLGAALQSVPDRPKTKPKPQEATA